MDPLKSGVALVVTVLVVAGTAVLLAVLVLDIGADEETWKRYVYLLTGVEAILFTAIGWLFGKEVHREQAANAEQNRNVAENGRQLAAENAAREAEKGRGLARAILATAAAGPAQRDMLARAGMADGDIDRVQDAGASSMSALVAHANSAYKDL